ncbi:MAG: ATP-binding cassette domain-containing protein [Sphingobacteriaceae bacterium]|nr:ATP-binding cassette domain-containing protein [Sphingobacteriaceae bacterium]
MRPTQRFFKLLSTFQKEISYLYFYAALAGLASLTLPLGMQAIIQFVMAGQVSTSLVLLVVMVVLGIAISGYLQIMQLWVAEFIQQQIFARGAFEFSHRIPRIKLEVMQNRYPPELVNRFFDVPQVQKGTAKVLIDFSIASLQMIFGLLLLSIYHPLFIALSATMLFALYALFRVTGKKGMETSIVESKYKYRTAFWLQEVARAITTFKISDETDLSNKKVDKEVSAYLLARKSHFRVLMSQYTAMVILKVLVAASLLGIGVFLVIDRQINLGQFVAAEIIILLVLGAVEKLILSMDVIYDLLTSLEKVGEVTDMPLEEEGGFALVEEECAHGISVETQQLSFTYDGYQHPIVDKLNIKINAGEKIGITGSAGGGKSTLLKLLAGFYNNYQGNIKLNGLRMQEIDRTTLHRWVGESISTETIFNASIRDNITLGRDINDRQLLETLKAVGLDQYIDRLPAGLQTELLPEGKRVSQNIISRIIMARATVRTPGLLLYEDMGMGLPEKEKAQINQMLVSGSWTLIAVTNDPQLLQSCDRVLRLENNNPQSN